MAKTNEDTKGERRERKRRKKRYRHKVSGRSVQTLQRVIVERAKEAEEEESIPKSNEGDRHIDPR